MKIKHSVREMTRCKPIPSTLKSVSNFLMPLLIPDSRAPGVYFCWREGELRYIGQSVDAVMRCLQHRNRAGYDQFKYIPITDGTRRLKLEIELIRYFEPEDNGEQSKLNHFLSPRNDEEMRQLTIKLLFPNGVLEE